MKRTRFNRLIGVIYITAAIFGLILSLGGLIVLWANRPVIVKDVTATVELTGRALTATHNTMSVLNNSLNEASTDLDMLSQMTNNMATSMGSSGDLINSTAEMVGGNMVDFVTNTQTSLRSVQSSAKVVDDFLSIVSAIPFIGARYRPDVPLQDSVAKVSESMNPLPDALKKIRRDLEVSSANVDTLKSEVQALGKQIGAIQKSVADAKRVIQDYQSILNEVQTHYDRFEARLPLILRVFFLGLTFVLVWVLMTQIGMLVMGLEYLQRDAEEGDRRKAGLNYELEE